MSPPLGIAVSGGPNASEIVRLSRLAEDLGYTSAWVAEGHGGDQFAVLGAVATATERLQLGTAITSVFVRTAPTIAMAAATVDQLSGGRFILGVGSSHRVQVEPEHGVAYAKPITRVRDTVAVCRALLRDGRVSYRGETVQIENFDLWFQPLRPDIPIYAAGLFPKMVHATGEIADGIILTRSTLQTAASIRAGLADGARAAGRDPAAIKVTSLLPTAVAKTRAEALDRCRPGLALYAGFFPRYNKLIASHGFEDEAARIAEAWGRGDQKAASAAVSDAMVDATSVAGTPEECRDKIQAYRESGLDEPIISPFARGPESATIFEDAIRACAPR
ncbi:MAG: LLM class flavin-dependent oxidoreductase [Alphaproteobacteria bacterium]|nr:LLM class flavin-dependent oxidoreductase [Alphaproteobacteria bacterium]MCB9929163.1 LLM class flavin-dependent oxidoreductase [Alphaproteobacteria bacterium]